MLLHYLVKHGNTKMYFFTEMLYYCFSRVQPVASMLDFFSFVELKLLFLLV